MQFIDAYSNLLKSSEYKEWKKNHKDCITAHALIMIEGTKESEWQIGFYNPKTDKECVFSLLTPIKVSEEMEIFKKPNAKIDELDMKKIKVDLAKARELAENVLETEFKPEKQTKIIVILQKIMKKQIWNITFITQSFNMINIRIDSEKGKILSKKISSLYSLGKPAK